MFELFKQEKIDEKELIRMIRREVYFDVPESVKELAERDGKSVFIWMREVILFATMIEVKRIHIKQEEGMLKVKMNDFHPYPGRLGKEPVCLTFNKAVAEDVLNYAGKNTTEWIRRGISAMLMAESVQYYIKTDEGIYQMLNTGPEYRKTINPE